MEFDISRMGFTIKRRDFLSILHTCQGVIPAKGPKQILSFFHLKTVPGGIMVTATDLDNTISAEAPASVSHDGSVALLAKMLLEIVRELPEADVFVNMQENETVRIKCGNADFQLSGQPADEFPAFPDYEEGSFFSFDCKMFGDMIRKVIIGIPASVGEARYSMPGVQLSVSGEDITMVSTDGHRLCKVQRKVIQTGSVQVDKTAGGGVQILLSRKVLSEVKKIIDEGGENIQASFQERHAIFKKDKLILISRLLENNYTDYRQTIPVNNVKENVIKVDRDLFARALKRVAVLSDERNHGIRIQMIGNTMTLESQDLELGDAHESITVDYQGKDMTIGLNVAYLLDALGVINEKDAELELSNAEGPCFIRPIDGPDYLCLIMPMRIDD